MVIDEKRLSEAVAEYIETDLAPMGRKLESLDQFLFGVKLGVVKRKANGMIHALIGNPAMKTIAMVDENGYVDVETLYCAAMDSIRSVGAIEIAGFSFREQDIEKLYSIIQRHGG